MKHNVPRFEFKGTPLSKETYEFMGIITCTTSEIPLEYSNLADEFLAQILIKRIRAFDLPLKVTALFFVYATSLWVDRPGNVIILLRLMYQWATEKGWRDFGSKEFLEMFPTIPTKEELQEFWLSQKIKGERKGFTDNMLDYAENWDLLREEST